MKWILAAVLVLGLVAWLASRRGGGRRPSAEALRRRLQGLTPDPKVAERLVEAEMKRHPEMSEAEVLRRVIRRLESDRR